MGYRYDDLAPGEIYHIYTRGVERRDLFLDEADRKRFLDLLSHSLPQGSIQSYSVAQRLKVRQDMPSTGNGLVDLLAYCLMSNHVHILVRENMEGGISLYMQRLLTSYARYFNTRRDRSGSLFVNPFRAVLVDGDEQLLHVSRYIHLNPFVAGMVSDPLSYKWSSLPAYTESASDLTCHIHLIHELLPPAEYRKFVTDEVDYARSLSESDYLLIDNDD